MKKIKVCVFLAVSFIIYIFSGCIPVPLTQSFKMPGKIATSPIEKGLIINYPQEYRPTQFLTSPNKQVLALIPLVFYVHANFYHNPQIIMPSSFSSEWSLKEIGDIIKKDIENSQIFADLIYLQNNNVQITKKADLDYYMLDIKIKDYSWHRNMTAYGLSFLGGILWIVGAPMSYGKLQIILVLELKDSNNNLVAKKTISSQKIVIEWIYTLLGGFRKLPECYSDISKDIRSFLLDSTKQ